MYPPLWRSGPEELNEVIYSTKVWLAVCFVHPDGGEEVKKEVAPTEKSFWPWSNKVCSTVGACPASTSISAGLKLQFVFQKFDKHFWEKQN